MNKLLKMVSGLLAHLMARPPATVLPAAPDGKAPRMMRLRGMGQWRCEAWSVVVEGKGAPPKVRVTLIPDMSADGGGDWLVEDCDWMRAIADAGGNAVAPETT